MYNETFINQNKAMIERFNMIDKRLKNIESDCNLILELLYELQEKSKNLNVIHRDVTQ